MTLLPSPFEFGRELGAGELVDREEEVSAVLRTMTSGGKLFLIGPRRYGKTCILRAATDRAEAERTVVLRYNAEAFPSLELLAARILRDAASALTGSFEKAATFVRDHFAALRPQVTADPAQGTISVSLAASPVREPGVPLLTDVLNGLEQGAQKFRRPVALVVDEFQKIVQEGGVGAEGQIRAAIQGHSKVGYVLAGSATRLLTAMTTDAGRPFYRLGEVRFVGPLPRADFAAFLEQGFVSGGIPVFAGAINAVLELAHEVPYNVQLLASACWEACRAESVEGSPRALTPDFVRATNDRTARRYDPLYTQQWTALTTAQQKALLALIRERGEGLASTSVARRYGVAVPTIQTALRALESKSVIREHQAHGKVEYRMEDPLFAAWIELVVPR